MPSPRCNGPSRDGPNGHGELSAAISTAVVHVVSLYTGRGPTHARTTIDGELVVVILRDGMTKGECALVIGGREAEVLQLRRAFQDNMRQALVAVIERLTERHVEAFMSANHAKPDAGAEIFLLGGDVADDKHVLR
jgi:uncharacterized protein YbcI